MSSFTKAELAAVRQRYPNRELIAVEGGYVLVKKYSDVLWRSWVLHDVHTECICRECGDHHVSVFISVAADIARSRKIAIEIAEAEL